MSTVAGSKYPFGDADVLVLTATGTQALTVGNNLTIIDGTTNTASGNRTINLTISAELKTGARIVCKSSSASTQTLTFGTGITAPVLTGVAAKTFLCDLVYDGTTFLAVSVPYQIN